MPAMVIETDNHFIDLDWSFHLPVMESMEAVDFR